MPFLDVLETLSPWWWVAAAFAIGALEMITGTAVLIWIALAALAMAAINAAFPGLSGAAQLTLFATLSVVLTFAGRWLVNTYGDGAKEHATLNQRSQHLVGRMARVLDFDPNTNSGAVEIEGMRWRATWIEGASKTGGSVRVSGAEGMNLQVSAVAE